MPGINFDRVRDMVPLLFVLEAIGWKGTARIGETLRGPCPIHRSTSATSRSFAVKGEVWYCHRCREGGGIFALYGRVKHLGVFEAALELCRLRGVSVPWISRGSSPFGGREYREEAR